MDRISIFNYEAFYLDYLEGNLSEEDTALLMAFLEANPDLRLDDDSLPEFDAEDLSLDVTLKQELKQPAEDEAFDLSNAEYFMIADSEGLLVEKRHAELAAFVNQHPGLARDKAIYDVVRLEPDTRVVYGNKESLKRKSVVLWTYVSIAAAASVILFFLVWSLMNNAPIDSQEGVFMADDEIQGEVQNDQQLPNQHGAPEQNNVYQASDLGTNEDGSNGHSQSNDLQGPQTPQVSTPDRRQQEIDRMDRRLAGPVLAVFNDREIEPITKHTFGASDETQQENSGDIMASAQFSEMKNPIEPITKFVSEKTKTEVDFRTSDKKSSGNKGFFLKIGKFEFSRKKH